MKIHRVHIQNIASLKGHHDLDFDQFALEHGSFAITGDTGAGKSTILNCISLALYGRSYKALNQGDFVTLGESAGKVELEFSCAGKRFLSIWGCRVRKKNGEYLKTPSHTKEFYLLTSNGKEILECNPEDVIHLSFEQFCKTVILNQGEFARFLTSSFRERKDILEKLYQGEKLDVFNPLLRDKISYYVQTIDQLDAQMEGLGQGLEEEIDLEALKDLERNQAQQKRDFEIISQAAEELADIADLTQKNCDTAKKLKQVEVSIQELVKSLNLKTKARADFGRERDTFLSKQKELAAALNKALERLSNLRQAKQNHIQAVEKHQVFAKSILEEKAGLAKIEENTRALELKRKALEESPIFHRISEEDFERLKEILAKHTQEQTNLKNANILYSRVQKDWVTWKQEREKSSSELIDCAKELADFEKQISDNNPQLIENRLKTLQEMKLKHESFLREANHLTADSELATKQLEITRKESAAISDAYEKNLEAIKIQKDALKAIKLEAARITCVEDSLEQGSCVVCANTEIAHLDLSSLEQSQEKIASYESNLEKLELERTNTFQALEKSRTAQSAHEAAKKRSQEKLNASKGQFLASHHELLAEFKISEDSLLSDECAENISKAHSELQEKAQELKMASLKIEGLKEKDRSILQRKELADKKLVEVESEGIEAKKRLTSIQEKLTNLEEKAKDISNLESFEKTENFLSLKQDWIKTKRLLDESRKDLKHKEESLSTLEERAREAQSLVKKLATDCVELEAAVKKVSPGMDPAQELKELEKQAEIIELQRKKLDDELQSLEVEKSAMFSRKQTLAEQLKDQENLILTHWSSLKELPVAERLEDGQFKNAMIGFADQDSPVDLETLELAKELCVKERMSLKEDLERVSARITEFKTILKRQSDAKDKIKALAKEKDKNKLLKEEWEELHILIGKDEFRNYILAMVEKLLIQQTNAELSKLCDGRYLIQHKQSSSRLAPDFYIIDKFRGDETRKVSTLSGGETFMVSLAMALALAELTRGNADIDSFFIDEGFGTLDQDSLEEALEMIQDIETRGKQIGLISHVKELTNRIPVNVHLVKNRLGNSSIEIVYN